MKNAISLLVLSLPVLFGCAGPKYLEYPAYNVVLTEEGQEAEVLMTRVGAWYPDQHGWNQSATIFGGLSGQAISGVFMLTDAELIFFTAGNEQSLLKGLTIPVSEINSTQMTSWVTMKILVVISDGGLNSISIDEEGEGIYPTGGPTMLMEVINRLIEGASPQ